MLGAALGGVGDEVEAAEFLDGVDEVVGDAGGVVAAVDEEHAGGVCALDAGLVDAVAEDEVEPCLAGGNLVLVRVLVGVEDVARDGAGLVAPVEDVGEGAAGGSCGVDAGDAGVERERKVRHVEPVGVGGVADGEQVRFAAEDVLVGGALLLQVTGLRLLTDGHVLGVAVVAFADVPAARRGRWMPSRCRCRVRERTSR